MNNKRFLILRACGSEDENEECENIASQCRLYGFDVDDYCLKNCKELDRALQNSNQYDYMYLSSHGNENGFGNENGTIDVPWNVFSYLLCKYQCMNDDCIVFLSCCRGGLHQVAYEMFYNCSSISYIVGPRQSLTSSEMLISFSVLLFNIEVRNIDPIVACEKIKLSTDLRFICFDSLEIVSDYNFVYFGENYDSDCLSENIDKYNLDVS